MRTFFLTIFSISFLGVFSQDPLHSHFFLNLPIVNPSLSGITESQRYFVNYRNQFPGLPTAFTTYTAGFETPAYRLHGAMGAIISNDVIAKGVFNTLRADFFYAYHLKINDDFVMIGSIQPSIVNKNLNTARLSLTDSEIIPSRNAFLFDVGVGFTSIWRDLIAGIAFHHLSNTTLSGTDKFNIQPKISAHASYYIPIAKNYFIPSILIENQSVSRQITYGGLFMWQEWGTGMWLRQDEKFSVSSLNYAVRFDFHHFTMVYSYDFPLRRTNQFINLGAHEVTFLIKNKYKRSKPKKFKAVKCPKI